MVEQLIQSKSLLCLTKTPSKQSWRNPYQGMMNDNNVYEPQKCHFLNGCNIKIGT